MSEILIGGTMQPISHMLIPFILGLLFVSAVEKKNTLLYGSVEDRLFLFGLALGGFVPDLDSIRNPFGIVHRGIMHTWWMGLVISFSVGLLVLGITKKFRKSIAFFVGMVLGYWSHLFLDFHVDKYTIKGSNWIVYHVLNVGVKNSAEMILDVVLFWVLLIFIFLWRKDSGDVNG